MISIVVPCYNEKDSLPYFMDEIKKVMEDIDSEFEVLFINDGSNDDTLKLLKKYTSESKKKKYTFNYISFSRNFGKESAMLAGLRYSKGDYVCVMDVDLQDPPYLIKKMYDEIKTGEFDCVGLRRTTRTGEPVVRSFFARCYYKLINKISSTEIVDGARDFRLMNRQMVDAILSLNEHNRYSKGIFSWVGFKTKWLEYENTKRVAGTTKWSFMKLFTYSIESILAFSTFPLILPIIFGVLLMLISMIVLVLLLINYSSILLLVLILLLLFSIDFIFTGVIGLYLSKIHIELQDRPIYIIKETNIK